jgi:hypothetical protein
MIGNAYHVHVLVEGQKQYEPVIFTERECRVPQPEGYETLVKSKEGSGHKT